MWKFHFYPLNKLKNSDFYNLPKSLYDLHKIKETLGINAVAERKEIAEKFGISKTTVNDIAERNDAYAKAREKRDKKILELLNKGLMAIEVAKVLGISDSTVSRVAHKNGIYLAPKRK